MKSFSKTQRMLCGLLCLVSVVCGSLTTYATSYQWDKTANGWKLKISETEDYIYGQWISVDGKWYYLNEYGYMHTGWILLDNHWYFLHADGAMGTGWVYINDGWYYFDSAGRMLSNTTTPDGYRVGASGAWIEKKSVSKSSGGSHGSSGSGGHSNSNRPAPTPKPEPDEPAPLPEPSEPEKPIEPEAPEEPEVPVASDSNADALELKKWIEMGLTISSNDQQQVNVFVDNLVSEHKETVVLISHEFYPYSAKLNQAKYPEIESYKLSHKNYELDGKEYFVTIYTLSYAHQHTTDLDVKPASCTQWGYEITFCTECNTELEKLYVPPLKHEDSDSDLVCELCEKVMPCEVGTKQSICSNLSGYEELTFSCMDTDYRGGMLFLSNTVIPYQNAVWYDKENNDYTWADIRTWLNLDFYNGLSVARKVLPIKLETTSDNFADKVFCLSKSEITTYSDWAMQPWDEENGASYYWSRTADKEGAGYVYAVHYSGHIASEKVDSTNVGIRPAYIMQKPEEITIESPIWLEGDKQERDVIFRCKNPDFESANGNRGALFYTDATVESMDAALLWMENTNNQYGILEYVPYVDDDGIHPGFIAEQK